LQRIEESAFEQSGLSIIHIPAAVEVLCKCCFLSCTSLTSVTFESNSKLQRIEESAFGLSDLKTIDIPASVEVVCKFCFSNCTSLTSVTFESNSKLQRIEEFAFGLSDLKTIEILASVEVVCKSCSSAGTGVPVDFTVAPGENSFGCCLERGQGVDTDIGRAVLYYRKAASQSHPHALYNFGRCLEYGKEIGQNLIRAMKW
jgi:hypothetical protein